jgi:hypothetical protein
VAQHKSGDPSFGTNPESSGFTNLIGSLLPQGVSGFADTVTQLSQGITNLVPANQLQAEALLANTQAVLQNTTVHTSGSTVSTITNIASSLTGGLLGLSPILSGLVSLFGSGGSHTPPPLVQTFLPPSISFQGTNVPGPQTTAADFNQSGGARAIGGGSSTPPQAAPQITVNVQAMDSRSFMDHSQDIAQAVREAMLNMHALNDVISDL